MSRPPSDRAFPARRMVTAIVLVCCLCVCPPVGGQEVDSLVADARGAAEASDYAAAVTTGVTALEVHPESEWDPAALRALITEVSQLWLHRMSTAEKQTLLELLADAQSPGAKWTKAYALYKLKKRAEAVTLLKSVIDEHPDGVGTQFAIVGWLVAQWSSLRDAEVIAAVNHVVKAAPNNPGSAWALCRITWRFGAFEKFALARTTLTGVMTAQ